MDKLIRKFIGLGRQKKTKQPGTGRNGRQKSTEKGLPANQYFHQNQSVAAASLQRISREGLADIAFSLVYGQFIIIGIAEHIEITLIGIFDKEVVLPVEKFMNLVSHADTDHNIFVLPARPAVHFLLGTARRSIVKDPV